jgi:AraC-like DNA-binding protein
MKTSGSTEQQLVLKQMVLIPGGEWITALPGWTFVHLRRGIAYLIHPRLKQELGTGSVVLLSERFQAIIRSSQMTESVLDYFYLQPRKHTGLFTMAEQGYLSDAARNETFSVRHFSGSEPLAQEFQKFSEEPGDNRLNSRVRALMLFTRAFEHHLNSVAAASLSIENAKNRLEAVLKQMPASEILDLSFADLAGRVGCSTRHLGRIFQQTVGMPFRDKQTEVRLGRAQDLLASTNFKVLDVAMESGYQSLSLFNLMFKRGTGMTPGQWRQQTQRTKLAVFRGH